MLAMTGETKKTRVYIAAMNIQIILATTLSL
jgi:hypothetical protein